MKIIVSTILTLSLCSAIAQTECNCKANFDTLTTKIQSNYAGYFDRIKIKGELAHTNAFNIAKQRAALAQTPKDCFYALVEYVRFFKDAHMGFNYLTDSDFNLYFEKVNVTQEQQYLKTVSESSIEGIWQNVDTSMVLNIVKDKTQKGRYKAVVVKSTSEKHKPGLVYCTLNGHKSTYFVSFFNVFSSYISKAKKKSNTLYLDSKLWVRQTPFSLKNEDKKRIAAYKKAKNGLFFEKIDSDVAYLKIETLANNDAEIDAFIKKQDAIIRQTPYLIVDFRGNGGGSTGWISIAPYIYTNTLKQGSNYARLSKDNTPLLKQNIKNILDMEIAPDMKRYFTDDFIANKKKEYESLNNFQGAFFATEGVNIPFDSVLILPKKIALLVDEGTGSSCEYFLHLSKQSTKTTSFGRNTMGIMDYVGQSNPTELPFKSFYLVIPTEKSEWTNRFLTNQQGMKPDVLLDKIDDDLWINWVVKYFKELK